MRITEEQIERANSVNLPLFLMANGFELKKVGREYSWKEHDSLHIKDNEPSERGRWFRFSTDEGGDNISFVREYMGKSFVEAVEMLNGEIYVRDFVPSHSYEYKPKNVQKSDITITENADCKRVFAYLCKTRGLDYNMISKLVKSGKIVQEQKTGNAVFKIFDEDNRLVGAEKVGTSTQQKFKGIATGSASGYGFEVCKGNGENALFFESAIDMLSYLQMYGSQLENHRLVSMMGVKPSVIIDTMKRFGISPENVFICSDNDKAGNELFTRLQNEFPQIKRIFPDNRYKDWNDALRDIPKEKEEVGKVTTYGNKTWNDATDNRNKTLVSMNENTFMKLKNQLDNSGINYFAYAKKESVVMAVNDKDIDWLKQLAGNENLPTRKSNVEYIPPQKNIIGNAEYRYISDKQYISADSDTALKMAEIMLSRNVQFSGRIYPNGKATLTVSGADLAHVKSIQQSVIDMRKPFARESKASEIIGNKAYRDIRQRQIYYSKLTPEQYKEVQPYLDTNAEYSGLIRDNKVIFTVEKDDSATFHRALENAQREVGIINTLKNNGIDDYHIEKLSAVIHRFAVEDIHESLDSFFTPQLDEKQFDKMLSLVNDYLAQAVSERYGEYSGLNAILDFKNEIDRIAELTEFFSVHTFSDEQKNVITEMFVKDSSKTNIEVIDETFSPDEIREYYDILHNQLVASDVTEFLENRRKIAVEREKKTELTPKEKAFLDGDIMSFMVKSALENRLNENEISEFFGRMQNGEDIRRDLAVGLLGGQEVFITNHNNEFTVEYGENSVVARYGNAERQVSYEDLGDAFFKLFRDEYDEIIHDRTVEDLRTVFPDISKETADKLIKAFESALTPDWQTNSDAVKNALNDILGDKENTEKAFASIADMKYNFKVEPKTVESPIHFGLLGNGITAYDISRTDKETNDYPTVAHISPEGIVKVYDDSISADDIARINDEARSVREKFMAEWDSLDTTTQLQKLYDRADTETMLNIGKETLSTEEKITKYMPFVFFGEGERPKPEISSANELGASAEIRGEENADIPQDDAPLFSDADVIEEIEKSENASDNRPFWETPDVQGEQLSLFGDFVPFVAKKVPEQNKEIFAEGLFVGNVNRFTALHDEIMRGTGFQNGKFSVKQFYDEKKPANKEFADFLKNEYGTGGHSGDGEICFVDHDSKGMFFTLDSGEKFKFTWSDVAEMTSAIIDKDEYITQTDIDRRIQNAEYTNKDIPVYKGEWKIADNKELYKDIVTENKRFAEMVKSVIGNGKNPSDSVKALTEEFGFERTAWLTALNIAAHPLDNRFYPMDKEWACKVLAPHFEIQPDELFRHDAEKRSKFDKLISGGTLYDIHNTHLAQFAETFIPEYEKYLEKAVTVEIPEKTEVSSEKSTVLSNSPTHDKDIHALSAEDKQLLADYPQIPMPTYSPWGAVQECTEITHGVFEVSTAGHGGIMIADDLAEHILSDDARKIGFIEDGWHCFEEDADAQIPLRELLDKSIMDKDKYFAEKYRSTFEEKGEWFDKAINDSISAFHPDYWSAYTAEKVVTDEKPKQAELSKWTVFTNKNNDGVEYGYIGRLKNATLEMSGKNTELCSDYFDDNVEDFNIAFARSIAEKLNENGITDLTAAREFVSRAVSEREDNLGLERNTSLLDAMNMTDLVENKSEIEQFSKNSENFTITDDSLGNGGAKAKFRANVEAIRTLKTIESENRPATAEEKEILSKYVGWGGIPQAFDSENKAWNSEFSELKEMLTDKEYSSARASTLDAFFTSPTVIDGIYQALENFGFEGGNVLEPAMGVGNFFGRMPENMRADSKLYGVEIDDISGRIAKQIYPDADIAIKGFEENTFQNDCFDVAVGNIPFGELSFKDDKHQTAKLHDYFFAESLEKVKNGGILAFVTSAGTLDKRDESTRLMLADKTDFIGAIRLPGGKNGAFKDNAGTEVTTDIIFLKKHEDKSVAEMSDIPDWVHIGETADGLPINKYFAENPDMVLGKVVEGNKLYGTGTMVIADENSDLSEQLKTAVSKLSATISDEKARDVYAKSAEGKIIEIPSNLRNYSFFEQDNKIYFKTSKSACHCRFDTKNSQFRRAKAFINLRDLTRELIEAQELDKPDEVIKDLQVKLNTAYDDFYKKYGLIHSQSNKRYFSDDISYNLVAGLEKKYDKTKLVEKSDIFFKRTIQPPKAVEHVETAIEALTLSIAEKARVDFEYMSSLTGMTENELKHDLQGEIYKVPHTENDYQTASEYLSGDIRVKLKIAQEVAEYDGDFAVNVNALKNAMPTPLKAGDIDVKIGATWLDSKYYEQFMYETFGTPKENRADVQHFPWQRSKLITAEYSEHSGTWHIDNKSQDRSVIAMQQFGTKKMGAYEIMEHLLNLKEPKIYKTIEVPDPENWGETKEKRVVDVDATKVVQRKADKIREAFKKWIFKDPARREEIVEKYNELFNSIRPREFDGSALKFPMMNADITLHEHQKNAIAHAMFGGNTLFAHSVGAGKTFEMIATAMESKRLGLCTKSLFAVPNHLTEQIGDDFQKLYPGANILVATKKDFQKENRQQLFAKIATGNFDAVIIGHSQLGMIPISKERQEAEIQAQINDIIEGIAELKHQEGSKFQIKAMERTKKSLEKQLDKLNKNHDDTITFEQLGVDKLFVDEAHEFKNLFCPTKMNNVSGISNSASQKALDLYLKCRYLDEKTGGTGCVFATGTPLSNSVTELHTMMRYLEYDFLKSKKLQHFDNWVSVFGNQKTDWELAPAGNKFKERTRIANYTGLPELMSMFKQIADIRTADTLKLDVPDCEYKIVNVDATPFQKELVQELSDRADAINAGNVEPTIDNMLKVTSDGRKLGLDPRLIDSSFEDNPETKLNKCVENVVRIHAETAENKLTQIIFCDLGVPHKNSTDTEKTDGAEDKEDSKSSAERESLEEECDFCVYDDIKKKLMDNGIPESEIAYIHNAKTEKQKSELFDKVRSGEVRVLLGSTNCAHYEQVKLLISRYFKYQILFQSHCCCARCKSRLSFQQQYHAFPVP